MTRRHEPPPTDRERIRSRCGSCQEMALEGKPHNCSSGNDQAEWVNPHAPK